MLRQGGHIAQQFDPTPRRTLGVFLRMSFMHRWRAESGEPFARYTVPAYELRRTLEEVRARGEAFAIEYERLAGVLGDEGWRKHGAPAAQVRYNEDGRGGRTCEARAPGALFWSACDPEAEVAMRPPPSGLGGFLMRKATLFFAYPIIDGIDELPCMD